MVLEKPHSLRSLLCEAELELSQVPGRSSGMTKRAYHELSGREKREVADELMLPTSLFGVVLMAAVLLLAFFLGPFSSSESVPSGVQYNAGATPSPPQQGG